MLYALEVPPEGAGGDTVFTDNRLAYRNLPAELRARIEGRTAIHAYDTARKEFATRIRSGLEPRGTRATHPVVLEHPDNGERLLYVSMGHTDRILELPSSTRATRC